MTDAHKRKKQPELVRRALLDAAGRMAAEGGLAALSIPAVAAAAGVTKGALFHHFGSKQGLVEAASLHLVETMDAQIAHYLGDDSRYGCFTRAYVASIFQPTLEANLIATLSISLLSDQVLAQSWSRWLRDRLERHRSTDGDPALEMVRLAADGYWLADLVGVDAAIRTERTAMFRRLMDMTEPRTD